MHFSQPQAEREQGQGQYLRVCDWRPVFCCLLIGWVCLCCVEVRDATATQSVSGARSNAELPLDDIEAYLRLNQPDQAIQRVLTAMGAVRETSSYRESRGLEVQLTSLGMILRRYQVLDLAVQRLMPGPAAPAESWVQHGRMCECFGLLPEARKAYETAVALKSNHPVACMELAGFCAQDDPNQAARYMGCIEPNAPELGVMWMSHFQEAGRRDNRSRLKWTDALAGYLAQVPDSNVVDLDWVKHVPPLLYTVSHTRKLNTPTRRSYQSLCHAMLNTPQLSYHGFSGLYTEAASRDETTEEYARWAREAFLRYRPYQGVRLNTSAMRSSGFSPAIPGPAPDVLPVEYLIQQAFEKETLHDTARELLAALEQQKRAVESRQLALWVQLYQVGPEVIHDVAEKMWKSSAASQSQASLFDSPMRIISCVLNACERRGVLVDLSPIIVQQMTGSGFSGVALGSLRSYLVMLEKNDPAQVTRLYEAWFEAIRDLDSLQWHQASGLMWHLVREPELQPRLLSQAWDLLQACPLRGTVPSIRAVQAQVQQAQRIQEMLRSFVVQCKRDSAPDRLMAYLRLSGFLGDLNTFSVRPLDVPLQSNVYALVVKLMKGSGITASWLGLTGGQSEAFGQALLRAHLSRDPATQIALCLDAFHDELEALSESKQAGIGDTLIRVLDLSILTHSGLAAEARDLAAQLIAARIQQVAETVAWFDHIDEDDVSHLNDRDLSSLVAWMIQGTLPYDVSLAERVIRRGLRTSATAPDSLAASFIQAWFTRRLGPGYQTFQERVNHLGLVFKLSGMTDSQRGPISASMLDNDIRSSVQRLEGQIKDRGIKIAHAIKSLYHQIGPFLDGGSGTPLIHFLTSLWLSDDLTHSQRDTMEAWVRTEAQGGDYPGLAQDMLMAYTMAATIRDSRGSSHPSVPWPEEVTGHYRAVLADERLSLKWRLQSVKSLCQISGMSPSDGIVLEGIRLLVEAGSREMEFVGYYDATIAKHFAEMSDTERWRLWAKKVLEMDAKIQASKRQLNRDLGLALLGMALLLDQDETADRILKTYRLEADGHAWALLVRHGDSKRLESVIQDHWNQDVRFSSTRFTAAFETQLAEVLTGWSDPGLRYYAAVLFYGLQDSRERAERPKLARNLRVKNLASRFDHGLFTSDELRQKAFRLLVAQGGAESLPASEVTRATGDVDVSKLVTLRDENQFQLQYAMIEPCLKAQLGRGSTDLFKRLSDSLTWSAQRDHRRHYDLIVRTLSRSVQSLMAAQDRRWPSHAQLSVLTETTQALLEHAGTTRLSFRDLVPLHVLSHALTQRDADAATLYDSLSDREKESLFVSHGMHHYLQLLKRLVDVNRLSLDKRLDLCKRLMLFQPVQRMLDQGENRSNLVEQWIQYGLFKSTEVDDNMGLFAEFVRDDQRIANFLALQSVTGLSEITSFAQYVGYVESLLNAMLWRDVDLCYAILAKASDLALPARQEGLWPDWRGSNVVSQVFRRRLNSKAMTCHDLALFYKVIQSTGSQTLWVDRGTLSQYNQWFAKKLREAERRPPVRKEIEVFCQLMEPGDMSVWALALLKNPYTRWIDAQCRECERLLKRQSATQTQAALIHLLERHRMVNRWMAMKEPSDPKQRAEEIQSLTDDLSRLVQNEKVSVFWRLAALSAYWDDLADRTESRWRDDMMSFVVRALSQYGDLPFGFYLPMLESFAEWPKDEMWLARAQSLTEAYWSDPEGRWFAGQVKSSEQSSSDETIIRIHRKAGLLSQLKRELVAPESQGQRSGLWVLLVEQGCGDVLEGVVGAYWDRVETSPRDTFSAATQETLASCLSRIKSPQLRFFAHVWLSALPNSETSQPKTTRKDRLSALSLQYGDVDIQDGFLRQRILALLSTEPVTWSHLRAELTQEAQQIDLEDWATQKKDVIRDAQARIVSVNAALRLRDEVTEPYKRLIHFGSLLKVASLRSQLQGHLLEAWADSMASVGPDWPSQPLETYLGLGEALFQGASQMPSGPPIRSVTEYVVLCVLLDQDDRVKQLHPSLRRFRSHAAAFGETLIRAFSQHITGDEPIEQRLIWFEKLARMSVVQNSLNSQHANSCYMWFVGQGVFTAREILDNLPSFESLRRHREFYNTFLNEWPARHLGDAVKTVSDAMKRQDKTQLDIAFARLRTVLNDDIRPIELQRHPQEQYALSRIGDRLDAAFQATGESPLLGARILIEMSRSTDAPDPFMRWDLTSGLFEFLRDSFNRATAANRYDLLAALKELYSDLGPYLDEGDVSAVGAVFGGLLNWRGQPLSRRGQITLWAMEQAGEGTYPNLARGIAVASILQEQRQVVYGAESGSFLETDKVQYVRSYLMDILCDETLSPGWRLTALRKHRSFFIVQGSEDEFVLAAVPLVLQTWALRFDPDLPYGVEIIRSFLRMEKDAQWRVMATEILDTYTKRSRENEASGMKAKDGDPRVPFLNPRTAGGRAGQVSILPDMIQLSKDLKDTNLLKGLRKEGITRAYSNPNTWPALIEKGKTDLVRSLVPGYMETPPRSIAGLYTRQMERHLPACLEVLPDDGRRYCFELLFRALPDSQESSERPLTRHSERLKRMVARFATIPFESPAVREKALAILMRHVDSLSLLSVLSDDDMELIHRKVLLPSTGQFRESAQTLKQVLALLYADSFHDLGVEAKAFNQHVIDLTLSMSSHKTGKEFELLVRADKLIKKAQQAGTWDTTSRTELILSVMRRLAQTRQRIPLFLALFLKFGKDEGHPYTAWESLEDMMVTRSLGRCFEEIVKRHHGNKIAAVEAFYNEIGQALEPGEAPALLKFLVVMVQGQTAWDEGDRDALLEWVHEKEETGLYPELTQAFHILTYIPFRPSTSYNRPIFTVPKPVSDDLVLEVKSEYDQILNDDTLPLMWRVMLYKGLCLLPSHTMLASVHHKGMGLVSEAVSVDPDMIFPHLPPIASAALDVRNLEGGVETILRFLKAYTASHARLTKPGMHHASSFHHRWSRALAILEISLQLGQTDLTDRLFNTIDVHLQSSREAFDLLIRYGRGDLVAAMVNAGNMKRYPFNDALLYTGGLEKALPEALKQIDRADLRYILEMDLRGKPDSTVEGSRPLRNRTERMVDLAERFASIEFEDDLVKAHAMYRLARLQETRRYVWDAMVALGESLDVKDFCQLPYYNRDPLYRCRLAYCAAQLQRGDPKALLQLIQQAKEDEQIDLNTCLQGLVSSLYSTVVHNHWSDEPVRNALRVTEEILFRSGLKVDMLGLAMWFDDLCSHHLAYLLAAGQNGRVVSLCQNRLFDRDNRLLDLIPYWAQCMQSRGVPLQVRMERAKWLVGIEAIQGKFTGKPNGPDLCGILRESKFLTDDEILESASRFMTWVEPTARSWALLAEIQEKRGAVDAAQLSWNNALEKRLAWGGAWLDRAGYVGFVRKHGLEKEAIDFLKKRETAVWPSNQKGQYRMLLHQIDPNQPCPEPQEERRPRRIIPDQRRGRSSGR